MDPVSQTRFDSLRKLDPINWSEDDRAFMTARRGYLPTDEVKVFGLEPSESKEPTVEPPAEEPVKPAKKK